MALTVDSCVACGSRDWSVTEEWKGYRLATCGACGLVFTLNPDYDTGRYVAAYQGSDAETPVPAGHGHLYAAPHRRLQLESLAFAVPPPRLTAAERLAIRWLGEHAPRGAQVIDCGCGAGRFLRALERAGLRACGVEVSGSLVDLLRRCGLEAIRGTATDFEWEGPAPYAITLFEVIEHIPDPVEVMKTLRRRFPEARVLASCPSPTRAVLMLGGERGASDFPPNHFLRWTPRAMEIAFARAGYAKVRVSLPDPAPSELMPGIGGLLSGLVRLKPARAPAAASAAASGRPPARPRFPKRAAATLLLWGHRGYQAVFEVLAIPRARDAARRGASASSMLAVAE